MKTQMHLTRNFPQIYFFLKSRYEFISLKSCDLLFFQLLSVLRGDPKALKDIPTSANGFGHETLDLEEENQQLKVSFTNQYISIDD